MPRLSILLALAAVVLIFVASFFWQPISEAPAPNATSTPISTSTTTATSSVPVVVIPKPVPVPATTTPTKPFTQIVGGPIVALSPTGLSLTAKREAPWIVTFTSTTKFQKYTDDGKDLVPMKPTELYVGMRIRVIGTLLSDGTITARTVTFGNPAPSSGTQTLEL